MLEGFCVCACLNELRGKRDELVDKGRHCLAEVYAICERFDDRQRRTDWWRKQHLVVVKVNLLCEW